MILKKPRLVKPKKTIYSGVIITLLLLFVTPEIQSQNLNVNKISGEHSNMELSTIKKLTFSNGNLNVIRKSESPMDFPLNEIRHLTFSDLSSGAEMLIDHQQNHLVIFPNPAANTLNFRISSPINEPFELKIITLDGKTVFAGKISLSEGKRKYQVDISFIKQGLYFCHIRNNQFSTTKKFIKN